MFDRSKIRAPLNLNRRQLRALHRNLQDVKRRVKAEVQRRGALRGINLQDGERVTKAGIILPK